MIFNAGKISIGENFAINGLTNDSNNPIPNERGTANDLAVKKLSKSLCSAKLDKLCFLLPIYFQSIKLKTPEAATLMQ